MGFDAKLGSLLENLKLQDPWLPPTTWESIPCESGVGVGVGVPTCSKSNQTLSTLSVSPHISNSSSTFLVQRYAFRSELTTCLFEIWPPQESSLVRLVMNAMQGVKSSLISIQNLYTIFSNDPADRTFLQIPNLWNRASTTHSLANLLISIGCTGSLVFLLRQFVYYFTNPPHNHNISQHFPPYTLVNQAFAVAVGKVLEAYISGFDTIHASITLRRSSKHHVGLSVSGCLKSVVHSEITLLEFYLHTKELRTQIQALASICNLQNWVLCFSDTAFEDLITKATSEFCNFSRGGDLLTFLHAQLQVTSLECFIILFFECLSEQLRLHVQIILRAF